MNEEGSWSYIVEILYTVFCLLFRLVITMCLLFLDEALHSLCMVQNDCIDVLTKDGALFSVTLPFPVSILEQLMFVQCFAAEWSNRCNN